MKNKKNKLLPFNPWTMESLNPEMIIATMYFGFNSKESDMTEQLHFHFSFPALEKETAPHSSVLAWRIPGAGEPGGLLSLGSHRVGHD